MNLMKLMKDSFIKSLHEGNIAGSYRTSLHKLHIAFSFQINIDCKSLPVHRFKGIPAVRAILHNLHGEEAGKVSNSHPPLRPLDAYIQCFSGQTIIKSSYKTKQQRLNAILKALSDLWLTDYISIGMIKT